MTPSQARREGREAFEPGANPEHGYCPYSATSSYYWREIWFEGWHQAAEDYETELRTKKEEDEAWEAISYGCPWLNEGKCAGVDGDCLRSDCAPWHFKVNS